MRLVRGTYLALGRFGCVIRLGAHRRHCSPTFKSRLRLKDAAQIECTQLAEGWDEEGGAVGARVLTTSQRARSGGVCAHK